MWGDPQSLRKFSGFLCNKSSRPFISVWLDTDIRFYISVCCDEHLDTDPLQPDYQIGAYETQ